jgi:NAD(P)-dependent dehydrogenase (short-subunit alcohol dehydrogenase family)
MARVFITGSSDGLGLMAARLLIEEGHSVIAHARGGQRARETRTALPGAKHVVTGDLSSITQTRGVADQVNALGDVDAVIYNAAVGPDERRRIETADGLSHVFEINVLAPYILTALIARPRRVVYLTSGLHRGGDPALDDPQWEHHAWRGSQAYSDSKLYDLALTMAVARRWPEVLSNAVGPGWVPTKMGGAGAPDDLTQGYLTQAWLAVSDEPAALVSGCCFFHKQQQQFHPAARSPEVQDALTGYCARLSGIPLPA